MNICPMKTLLELSAWREAQDGGLCIHKAEVEIVQLYDPISSFLEGRSSSCCKFVETQCSSQEHGLSRHRSRFYLCLLTAAYKLHILISPLDPQVKGLSKNANMLWKMSIISTQHFNQLIPRSEEWWHQIPKSSRRQDVSLRSSDFSHWGGCPEAIQVVLSSQGNCHKALLLHYGTKPSGKERRAQLSSTTNSRTYSPLSQPQDRNVNSKAMTSTTSGLS